MTPFLLHTVIWGSALEAQLAGRDSLGVQIIETSGQRARAPSAITVRSEPEIQIGALDGDPAHLFSRISGVALLRGERVLIIDGQTAELRFFDLRGRLVGRSGRRCGAGSR